MSTPENPENPPLGGEKPAKIGPKKPVDKLAHNYNERWEQIANRRATRSKEEQAEYARVQEERTRAIFAPKEYKTRAGKQPLVAVKPTRAQVLAMKPGNWIKVWLNPDHQQNTKNIKAEFEPYTKKHWVIIRHTALYLICQFETGQEIRVPKHPTKASKYMWELWLKE